MSRQITGPHELQPFPPVAFARGAMRRAVDTTGQLRRLPVDTLKFAGRLTPFATVRTSIALTESLARRVLGLAEDTAESVAPRLYPGAREGQDQEAFTAPPDPQMSIHSMLTELLDRSVRQSPRQATEANQKRLLLQLVPDEARILHLLSNGKSRAMQYVGPGTMGGSIDHVVLRYASTVGTDAGVRCLDSVPEYLAHLVSMGLIDVGPEDPALREQYEILDTFDIVEAAETESKAESKGIGNKLRLKTALRERHTIMISKAGKDLWDAAKPDTHAFATAEQRPEPEIDMSTELPPEPE